MPKFGKLYVFEGADGVGKTTLSKWLSRELQKHRGQSVVWSSFPGNEEGSIGSVVYRLHHNPANFGVKRIQPLSLQLLHVAAHIDAIESHLMELLSEGTSIVLDRFWWSTWVYGRLAGADRRALDMMIALEKRSWRKIRPARVFLLNRPSSKSIPANRRMERLYKQLAQKESQSGLIIPVKNSGTIREAQNKILLAL